MSDNYNFKAFRATNDKELDTLESNNKHIGELFYEILPWAKETSYREIATEIIVDKKGPWSSPVMLFISEHNSIIGAKNLTRLANDFFTHEAENNPMDVLSISAGMKDGTLVLKSLLRIYKNAPNMPEFFNLCGGQVKKTEVVPVEVKGKLIIPDEIRSFEYSEEEVREHDRKLKSQLEKKESATKELPYLNRLDKYEPEVLRYPEEDAELIYDLKTKDKSVKTFTKYENFVDIFNKVMTYVSGVEYYHYVNVMLDEESEESFLSFLETYIKDTYVEKKMLAVEDISIMMERVKRALFQLYVVQDLIDDPDVTDVKITAPDQIRARVKGKAYLSNITFVDRDDYLRFVNGICLRNRVSQDTPEQTFTDDADENYILRFSLTAEYTNSVDWPYLHIRKVSRKKLMADELMKAGMFDEKIRDYLLDCGRRSRGVVFAGPPGSGKTVILNWFLEVAYEQSAEILVIQENDELFAYRKGVMFQHVVNYAQRNKPAISLEQLGQLALVAGANVFIIGEAKGPEICSAITLSNSGCRTAITIHSPSSTETIDKMADLAMRGYAQSYEQAKRSLKSFQTIVYLQDFKVQEISEITGYNEETKDMNYRYIYSRAAEKEVEQ